MAKLRSIFTLHFVNTLSFTLLIPVFPYIVQQYDLNGFIYGLLISLYFIFQFIFAPILGSLSDRFGRRPILLLSQAGTTASWIIFGFAYFAPSKLIWGISLPVAIIAFSRIVDGITGGNVAVAHAFLIDVTKNHERVNAFSKIISVTGIAMFLGPLLGTLTQSTSYGYLGTVIAATVLSLFALLMIHFKLDESLEIRQKAQSIRFLDFFHRMNVFRKNPGIATLFAVRFFYAFVMAAYTAFIFLYVVQLFDLHALTLAVYVLTGALILLFNQLYLVRKVTSVIGQKRSVVLALTSMCIGLVLLPLIHQLLFFVLTFFVLTFGHTLALPSIKALLSNSSKESGKLMGVDEGIGSLCATIVPLLGGALYALSSLVLFWFLAFMSGIALLIITKRFSSLHIGLYN